jgi:hypothetical protein
MNGWVSIVASAGLLIAAVPAGASDGIFNVELAPEQDTSISLPLFPPMDRNQGAAPLLYVGNLVELCESRGLVRFDTSVIPLGSEVLGVDLEVVVEEKEFPEIDLTLNRVTAAWGEGAAMAADPCGGSPTAAGATWTHTFYDTAFWSQAGGDFAEPASAVATVPHGPFPEPMSFGATPAMVADVQSWVDQPATNHGWILRNVTQVSPSYVHLGSREAAAGRQPRLFVEFISSVIFEDGFESGDTCAWSGSVP